MYSIGRIISSETTCVKYDVRGINAKMQKFHYEIESYVVLICEQCYLQIETEEVQLTGDAREPIHPQFGVNMSALRDQIKRMIYNFTVRHIRIIVKKSIKCSNINQ